MIIQSLVTALSTGLGCGTCCGSGVSMFLFGYLTTHAGGLKHSFRAFLSFYLGKILTVAVVCMSCSVLGRQILDENGNIGNINIHVIVNILMIAMGIWFIIKWIRERLHPGCENCHHCGSESHTSRNSQMWSVIKSGVLSLILTKAVRGFRMKASDTVLEGADISGVPIITGISKEMPAPTSIEGGRSSKYKSAESKKENGVSYPALVALGAGYGISPCAPLLMMAGYAVTLVPAAAFLTGCLFAIASAFIPMLILMFLTGILSSKIYKEIPQYIGIFRLISYIVLIIIFAVTM